MHCDAGKTFRHSRIQIGLGVNHFYIHFTEQAFHTNGAPNVFRIYVWPAVSAPILSRVYTQWGS